MRTEKREKNELGNGWTERRVEKDPWDGLAKRCVKDTHDRMEPMGSARRVQVRCRMVVFVDEARVEAKWKKAGETDPT